MLYRMHVRVIDMLVVREDNLCTHCGMGLEVDASGEPRQLCLSCAMDRWRAAVLLQVHQIHTPAWE